MEQTVMVFADAAARTTALTGVVSEGMLSYLKSTKQVEVYNGSAWVASDDPNAIQNSIINAKGDIIVGSANDTPAILSAPTEQGSTLVADSAASTGLRWQSAYNNNAIINGAFDIWQRGTSLTNSSSEQYCADRWLNWSTGAVAHTISRQSTGDTTNLPQIQYCARVQRDSGSTSTSIPVIEYSVETVDARRFSGQTISFSFYARAGANFSAASNGLAFNVATGTGTDQRLKNYTNQTQVIANTATLTTTWQRFTYTGTVSATATEIGCQFYFTPVGTAGANDYFEITGVQLELGSRATTFKRAGGGTIQGELAACQRYYQRSTPGSSNQFIGNLATATSTSLLFFMFPSKATMRVTPTSVDWSSISASPDGINTAVSISAIATSGNGKDPDSIWLGCTTSGATQFRPYMLYGTSSTSYIGVSAEL
jgi:hypothetical protein